MPFSVFDPVASVAAENAKRLVFHFVGDVGGVNGTGTQESGKKLPIQTTHPDVKLENFGQTDPGFLRVTADQNQILFEYFLVPFVGGVDHVTQLEQFTA